MVVRLWKWFIGWTEGFGIDVLPTDGPLVCGLVWVKLTVHVEEEWFVLVASNFFPSRSSINLRSNSLVLFACLSNAEVIMFWTSLREGDGLGHTSCITLGLVKMIGVVSFRTVPCHVTTQRERKSSSRLEWYASNVLRPSSVKVSKVGLRMLPLSRSDPLWLEFPPFMLDVLEVVDSPAESPKYVTTWIERESEAPAQNSRNRIIQFLEPDSPVLSGPTAVRGTTGLQRGSLSSGQAMSGQWRRLNRNNQGIKAASSRSNRRKEEKLENLGQKVGKVKIRLIVLMLYYNRLWPILIQAAGHSSLGRIRPNLL
jgi:hypothetical protein